MDFKKVLEYGSIPLPKVLEMLLKLCKSVLGSEVEIEFAVNLNSAKKSSIIGKLQEKAVFNLVQVRSAVDFNFGTEIKLSGFSSDSILFHSETALGHGIIQGITDVVFIREDRFDLSKSQDARTEISKVNQSLRKQGDSMILIGPGRWGSSDPWLGIPVYWGDINSAQCIVETPVKARPIDPSEGSHFFQNLTSLRVGYVTMSPNEAEAIDWNWLMERKTIFEGDYVMHKRLNESIEIRIDGRTGKCVVLKEIKK